MKMVFGEWRLERGPVGPTYHLKARSKPWTVCGRSDRRGLPFTETELRHVTCKQCLRVVENARRGK